jgi:hypothetical protein
MSPRVLERDDGVDLSGRRELGKRIRSLRRRKMF